MTGKLFSWLVGIFQRNPPTHLVIPDELNGLHDCGLRALHIALPEIPLKDIVEAFGNCCEWWLYKGVTNKEFNVVLSYLKIRDRFEYSAPDAVSLDHLLQKDTDIFIALIYGHYTVIYKGYVLEQNTIRIKMPQCKVYCYWCLVSPST